MADIKNWSVSLENTRRLLINNNSIKKYNIIKNDILIIRVNGSADIVGRFILCDKNIDAIYCDHFIRMRMTNNLVLAEYLQLLGHSLLIREGITKLFITTAGQKTINQKHVGSLLLPIPPLKEQARIVAKVDALMALCDEWEARLQAARHTQEQFALAAVALS